MSYVVSVKSLLLRPYSHLMCCIHIGSMIISKYKEGIWGCLKYNISDLYRLMINSIEEKSRF